MTSKRRKTASRRTSLLAAMEKLEPRSLLAAFPLEDTFELNSDPTAPHTIFLDFDGHTNVEQRGGAA